MFTSHNIFTSIFVFPILNALIGIYKLLLILGIPGAFGFSLIILTVLMRLILYPLTRKQLESTYKMGKLKPQLDKLSASYKDNKQKLHQEQLKLYQQEGINPAAGCLPLLLQMPILIALYNIFFQLLNSSNMEKVVQEVNSVLYYPFLKIDSLNLSFFGLNLDYKPSQWQTNGIWLLTVPVITALLQYWQTRLMSPSTTTKNQELRTKNLEPRTKNLEENKKGEKKDEDMSTVMQKQMTFMMPLMIGFFAYSFPLGLSLYWNTFTVFGIIQQQQLNRQIEAKSSKT